MAYDYRTQLPPTTVQITPQQMSSAMNNLPNSAVQDEIRPMHDRLAPQHLKGRYKDHTMRHNINIRPSLPDFGIVNPDHIVPYMHTERMPRAPPAHHVADDIGRRASKMAPKRRKHSRIDDGFNVGVPNFRLPRGW